jgi:hypothetical protein
MDDRLLDALLQRSRDEAGGLRLTGEGSMLGDLVKAVPERALNAELTAHLGYERWERAGHNTGNSRNGTIAKKMQTGIGPVGLDVPRDRAWSFEPVLIPKRSGRVSGGLDHPRALGRSAQGQRRRPARPGQPRRPARRRRLVQAPPVPGDAGAAERLLRAASRPDLPACQLVPDLPDVRDHR